ncbi:MAG: response regulator [Gammaproteobacteria bacterium]|nr:response regulator [Gammaproteobacteria bacterium]
MAKILVVDDDKTTLEYIKGILQKDGHEVFLVDDGVKVQPVVDAYPIDLVITDIIMPFQEGLATIMKLKNSDKNIPIIAISGESADSMNFFDGGYLEVAKDLGANATLTKPIQPLELMQCVNKLVAGTAVNPTDK